MKKISIVTVGAAALIALTGCVGTPTYTPSPNSNPAPAADSSSAFHDLVSARFGESVVEPAAGVAKSFCKLMDGGLTFDGAIGVSLDLATQNGVGAEDLGFIIGVGVPAFCPQYTAEKDAWAASH